MNVEITVAVAADAGEVMTVQRAAYVSEAQLYDNMHFSALSEPLESVLKAIADEIVLVARLGKRLVGAVRGRLEAGVRADARGAGHGHTRVGTPGKIVGPAARGYLASDA